MNQKPPVPKPAPEPPDISKTPISHGEIDSYFQRTLRGVHSHDGLRAGDESQRLGDVTSTPGDTETFGPIFIDYVLLKAGQSDQTLRGGIRSALADAQKERLERRQLYYAGIRKVNLGYVIEQSQQEPLFKTVLDTAEALRGTEAAFVVEEVAVAMGYFWRQRQQNPPSPEPTLESHQTERESA